MSEKKNEREIRLSVALNKEDSQKFLELKKTTGIQGNSDLTRFMISITHEIYCKDIPN